MSRATGQGARNDGKVHAKLIAWENTEKAQVEQCDDDESKVRLLARILQEVCAPHIVHGDIRLMTLR